MNKRVLAISVGAALTFHGGGIIWLYCFPTAFQNRSYDNAVNHSHYFVHRLEQEQRSEILGAIFEQMCGEETLVRENPELKSEEAPQLALAFPTKLPVQLAETDFSFTNRLSSPAALDSEGEEPGGISVIAPLTAEVLREAPPLADFTGDTIPYAEEGVVAGSEHFDIHVEYAPKRFRPGYVFKVTFLPKADVHFKHIRQNYYFLLDRSNSIPRGRYSLNKKAVADALHFLKPGDRFNILVFDDHVTRFAESPVEWSETAVEEAIHFLEGQGHGGYFAATDLYASLGKIIPHDVAEDEVNTAILLSDGDTYLSKEKQRVMIGGWTEKNQGKIALYTVTSGTGNNITLLDVLSNFNKGTLIYAHEHADVRDRLAYLMRTIKNPIGKQMVATAIPEVKSMHVTLQPKTARIPDLYQNRPFVIYGSTNKLSDFMLFLQGRYYDRRFDIKKKIVLKKASLVPYSVERGWTQLVVQEFYERYFKEGNVSYLEEAKQLLNPLNLPTPFIE